MTPDNEFAKRLFAAFASASVLKAEHRERSARLWALVIESQQIKAELSEWKPTKLARGPSRSDDPDNGLPRAWLAND